MKYAKSTFFTKEELLNSFLTLQSFILNKMNKNEKFFIGRLSGKETNLTGKVLQNIKIPNYLFNNLLFVAGIKFNNDKDILDYITLYNKSVLNCDLLGVWDGGMYSQCCEYYSHLSNYLKPEICAHALEPYYFMDEEQYKFYNIFNNKKVLIITSHYETTKNQLPNINKMYKKNIFDETTTFYIYKPSQQNGGNNDENSWNYHFNIMKNEINNIKKNIFDFDIALISCGGFGMIISNYIYDELNVSVMYIGGSLQLFFGIKGRRWNSNETISKNNNDYWTSVLECDIPKNPKLCENGCYW